MILIVFVMTDDRIQTRQIKRSSDVIELMAVKLLERRPLDVVQQPAEAAATDGTSRLHAHRHTSSTDTVSQSVVYTL